MWLQVLLGASHFESDWHLMGQLMSLDLLLLIYPLVSYNQGLSQKAIFTNIRNIFCFLSLALIR